MVRSRVEVVAFSAVLALLGMLGLDRGCGYQNTILGSC